MIINIVTPAINRTLFSGGLFCILKYADGLARKGYQVNVVPGMYSEQPDWIDCQANILLRSGDSIGKFSVGAVRDSFLRKLDHRYFFFKPKVIRNAIDLDHLGRLMPTADVTIATTWETVEPVLRFGSGQKAYFMQHFEPVFFAEPCYEKFQCELSYQMPLKRITNSQWLFERVSEYLAAHGISDVVYKCKNAVDLQIFRKVDRKINRDSKHVKVISYGGRCVAWKGFAEMAEALAMARRRLPDYNIEWLVYGDAALPPDNGTAPYVPLGFLNPHALCAAYNEADILLSASWYESFPLFPIEAMACGLATITTRSGTEEYAHHGLSAHIVEPRNPSSISDGLVRLVTDTAYRRDLSNNGEAIAKEHTWSRSVDTMEAILSEITNGVV
jgi:glycosyltransferase involved in cell wall biosynthesis